MTLLSICQNVARVLPLPVPTTIVANTDQTAQLLLGCAQEAGEILARRPQGGWVSMIREHDFTTTAIGPLTGTIANSGAGGVAVISALSSTTGLAADTWYASATGLLSNSIIASVDSATQVTLNQAASAVGTGVSVSFGKSDYALPSDFQRPVDATFWDRTRYWQMRGPLSPQQWQMYKSSIYGRVSIQRRFRFRNEGGVNLLSIDPTPFDNNAHMVFEYVSSGWCKSSLGVYQTAWAADTDVGVVDEFLIQLGIKWRALERLGLVYASAFDDYERQVSKAVAQDGGAAILDLAPSYGPWLIGPQSVQEGDFPSR